MPTTVFGPSASKTAKAPVAVSPSGLSCRADIFFVTAPNGSTLAPGTTVHSVTFTSTGASQTITWTGVTMPNASGVYYVDIDLYVEGYLLVPFEGSDTITIPTGTVGPPVWS